jgi:O-antigen/teichoic acid export membrane protein
MFTTRAARHYLQRGRPVISDFFLWTALQAFLVLPFLILLLFIPDSAGEAFLGDIWLATRKLLPILLVGSFLAQLVVAGEIYFRVVDRVSKFAWLRFVMVIPTVGLATMGALWGDAEGASWGLLLANAVTLGATAALVYADNKQSLSTSEPEGVTVD